MIGMEPTFEAHVENLVSVFEEVRRVLRPDGTLWLNYGDAYWSNPSNGRGAAGSALGGGEPHLSGAERKGKWLKPKDLMLMPARVAMALQEAGWWLRSEIIWHKPNPMPESVTDRPTSAHEKVFLFAKSSRYFYDAEAVRVAYSPESLSRYDSPKQGTRPGIRQPGVTRDLENDVRTPNPAGANLRNVWKIATAPFKSSHFATFPPALVEPCIKAGTSKHGVCSECGAPWKRVVDTPRIPDEVRNRRKDQKMGFHPRQVGSGTKMNKWRNENPPTTAGWRPTCECNADTKPSVVLDCFGGAGTVGLVADRLQRDAVLIEISGDYAGMARKRIEKDAGMFASIASRMTAKGKD